MNIAELFVSLGVKGSEKTLGALQSTRKGLKEVESDSLAVKAALIGVAYGLQQMMAKSGAMGTNLTQFAALTGLNTKTLQQWTYAAQQAGVANEEFQGSVKGVYDNMAKMRLNKGAPEGMGLVATTLGFSKEDMQHAQKDVFFLMSKLQDFAHSKVPLDIQNQALKSFGVSEGTIAAMRRGMFNEKNFSAAPTMGTGQLSQLNKVDVAWKNLGTKVEMAFGAFTSKHGMSIVKDLSIITDKVIRLAEAFTNLADRLKLFKAIGKVFEGWAMIFDGITGAVNGMDKKSANSTGGGPVAEVLNSIFGGLGEAAKGAYLTATESKAPNAPAGAGGVSSKTTNVNVNQNLHFQHDGKDHKKTSDSVHKSVRDAYKQLSAQSQGS